MVRDFFDKRYCTIRFSVTRLLEGKVVQGRNPIAWRGKIGRLGCLLESLLSEQHAEAQQNVAFGAGLWIIISEIISVSSCRKDDVGSS